MNDAAPADTAQPTAGALLRQAREHAGLHMASLAGMLKVPQRQLEALEQDRLDQLPDVVFARALAASVCRNLKVDPGGILERLPRGGDSRLGRDEPINLPFRTHDASSPGVLVLLRGRPAVAAALLLLLAAAALVLLPQRPDESAPTDITQSVTPAPQAATPGGGADPVQPALVSGAAVLSAPAVAAPGAAAVPAAPPAATALAPAPEAPGGVAMVEFRATQSSWVSVTDARGTPLLRRTLAAGENVPLNGVAPLAVTIGSVAGMQVLVRGRPLELNAARDNVARFEVR